MSPMPRRSISTPCCMTLMNLNPNRRYKIAYIAYDLRRKFGTTATAVSADGLRWKLVNTRSHSRAAIMKIPV